MGDRSPRVGPSSSYRPPPHWSLIVGGEVENPIRLNWDEFLRLPRVKSTSDFHCVEGWSVLKCAWEGMRFRTIVELVRPRPEAKAVTFECADGYSTPLTMEELSGDGVILAIKMNGRDLEKEIGRPMRLVVPQKYAYKSAMWIRGIRLTPKKEKGYWEKRGYSDTAEVWKDDRFSSKFGSMG